MKKYKNTKKITSVIFILIIGAVFLICDYLICYSNKQSYTVTINKVEKDRSVWYSEYDGKQVDVKYIIKTTTNEGKELIVQNSELEFIGKNELWDTQKYMEVGNTCKITTLGYEVPIFSYHPNIVKAEILK